MPGLGTTNGQEEPELRGKQAGRKTAIPKVGKGSGVLDEHGVSFCCLQRCVMSWVLLLGDNVRATATCWEGDIGEYTLTAGLGRTRKGRRVEGRGGT